MLAAVLSVDVQDCCCLIGGDGASCPPSEKTNRTIYRLWFLGKEYQIIIAKIYNHRNLA